MSDEKKDEYKKILAAGKLRRERQAEKECEEMNKQLSCIFSLDSELSYTILGGTRC